MRKSFSLLFACLALVAGARQISSDEAAAIASDFLSSSAVVKKAAAAVNVRRAQAKDAPRDAEENQPYYIFNAADDNGFVIIAGDDRSKKILGYSDTGNFDLDNMPPQLAAMLDHYAGQIAKLTADTADPSWAAPSRTTSADGEGVLLETANWGQGYPYNAQCPVIDGVQAPTGCVATAMAIVMKYHNWPEGYDWDSMPSTNLENACDPVSKLMKDAGEAVFMNYGPVESGANMNWVGHKLQQDFKYSPVCQFITKANFDGEEWDKMIKSNVEENNPVIYNGSGKGNHAFIIDGYKDDNYHINWGWDGYCNGYFQLNALIPNESYDFSSSQGMVINIAPDHSGKEYSKVFCDYGYFWAGGGLCPGAHFNVDCPQQNQEFDYTCHTLSYPCEEGGQLGLLLYDKEGNVKESLHSIAFTEARDDVGWGIWGNDICFYGVSISSTVMLDDYITLATRKSLSQPWIEVLGTIEAPIKKRIADISKDVTNITIINNVPNSKLYTYKDRDWFCFDESILECVRGRQFTLDVHDANGNRLDDVIITVEGKGIYGNTITSQDGLVTFYTYGSDYNITIDRVAEGQSLDIELAEAGTLETSLKGTACAEIDTLTIRGNINAADIWFIRENLKNIKSLDISNAKIMACDAIDPVEIFRIGESINQEDVLPTYALTGLSQLSELKLPVNLMWIDSNSLMSLSIEKIEIPESVTGIGLNVFFDCTKLNTIISRMPQAPYINDCVFTNTLCPNSGVLYVPIGSIESYQQTPVWKDFAQIIEDDNPNLRDDIYIYEGLKYRVNGRALQLIGYEQSELPTDVIIPDKIILNDQEYIVLGIDEKALQGAQMDSFVMSNSITTIGSWLFSGSSVKNVIMSDNIKYLPFSCIDGAKIETLHLPENAESICNSIYCDNLKKLHLPRYLHSELGYEGSIGHEFRQLEEITVDPENEEWFVNDGILFWKDLSHMILVPNSFEGTLIIPDETVSINQIQYCNNITEIRFGKSVNTLWNHSILKCEKLKHIEFNNDIIFLSNRVVADLPELESITIKDFIWSYYDCLADLPSLNHVYLLNNNDVDFSDPFYGNVNPNHAYFSSALDSKASIPYGCKMYIPGGIPRSSETLQSAECHEMWSYQVNRKEGMVKIEPQIEGIEIDRVAVNGREVAKGDGGIYYYGEADVAEIAALSDQEPLDVVVDYTLHGRQTMTTHYDAEFNAAIPDDIITGVLQVSQDDAECFDIYNLQGICVKHDAKRGDVDNLAPGVYIVNGQKVIVGR